MEKDYKKNLRKHAKQLIHEFLEENDCEALKPSSAKNSCCGLGLQEFDAQTHDAWILQCPKSLDPSLLEGKRIKMPGRRFVGELQVRGTEYTTPSSESIGYTNVKGKNRVSKIPISGVVVLSKRLNVAQPSAIEEDNSFPTTAPPPIFMKPVRHPFFGRDYKKRIKVPKAVSRNLIEAINKSTETSAFLRRNGNFYKIRKQIQGTTQTLEEKEFDVRQSVLTGVTPDFMKTNVPTYNLGDLTSGDKEVRIKKKHSTQKEPISRDQLSSVEKPKKRTANGEVKSNGDLKYASHNGADGASQKKRKKLIPNGEV
ncbi:uncharacterized protein LOC111070443 [Drosophila obscura]|uniref:uncharacterized protein LOC111070443 n=1 Tax=Drosophila obscura TaxID=7282 RepID=UPI001BB288B5|nr:uncharacterized protein LOC111070443 [Drosophila obscura]